MIAYRNHVGIRPHLASLEWWAPEALTEWAQDHSPQCRAEVVRVIRLLRGAREDARQACPYAPDWGIEGFVQRIERLGLMGEV